MTSQLDYTQTCILDDIAYLMHRYYLTLDDVANRIQPTDTISMISVDQKSCEESDREVTKKKFTTSRRAFKDALSSGLKICPNYDNCEDDLCDRFHIDKNDICPHAGRSNVCHSFKCDKIIIKGCRKGKNCTDQSCSFRH